MTMIMHVPAVITMVLYEYVLRDLDPGAYPETVGLPGWLVAGVQQAVLYYLLNYLLQKVILNN